MPSAVLSASELSQLQSDNEDHMNDLCDIMGRTDSVDGYGQPIASWSAEYSDVPCSFEFSPFKFRSRETGPGAETSEILVRARLPLSYYDDVTQEKRLHLTRRGAVTVSEDYEVQGFPEMQFFGITVNLKRVEP
jgi:head-tail adaptor